MSVIAELRVMLEDPSADLDAMIGEIRSILGEKLKFVKKEPIGFGITALHLTLLVEDREGGMEPIEKEIRGVVGVGEVDVISLDLT